MRHGAGPGTSGGADEVITQIENLSTGDALGHQRLGCCFCNDAASLINVHVLLLFLFYTLLLALHVQFYSFAANSLWNTTWTYLSCIWQSSGTLC